MKFKVKLTSSNFTKEQQDKLQKAAQLVEDCFNSDEFAEFILFHQIDGVRKFHYTKDNNTEVFTKIMSGSEDLESEHDYEADIFIELDRSYSWNVIGYTYPNTKWQWVYFKFFSRASIDEIAGNIAHEWCHKIGYSHEYKWTALREYSVPYAVGYFVERFNKERNKVSYFERFKQFFA